MSVLVSRIRQTVTAVIAAPPHSSSETGVLPPPFEASRLLAIRGENPAPTSVAA